MTEKFKCVNPFTLKRLDKDGVIKINYCNLTL